MAAFNGPANDLNQDWWPEVGYDWCKGKKCDFVLRGSAPGLLGLETKTAFVGRQGARIPVPPLPGRVDPIEGGLWSLNYYLTEGRGQEGGVLRDALRLRQSAALSCRGCLVFAYGEQEGLSADKCDLFASEFQARLGGHGVIRLDQGLANNPIELGDGLVLQILAFRV
jgi:hypothetical protein